LFLSDYVIKRHGNGTFASTEKKRTFKGRWEEDKKVEGEYIYEDSAGTQKVRNGLICGC
jgi:hypothetical protein